MQYEQNVNTIYSMTSVVNVDIFDDKAIAEMLYKGM